MSKEWAGVNCPFCGDSNFHAGFNVNDPSWFNCWRCGGHFADNALSLLGKISRAEAKAILDEMSPEPTTERIIGSKPFEFPLGCEKMNEKHKKYLENRGYDPKYLEEKYLLQGTTHLGAYRWRIVAPWIVNRQIVSYTARDITEKAFSKYKACEKEAEVLHHKHILYNIDNATKDIVIVFEGITSVWRWGDNTVATAGIKWTMEQADKLLSYKRVIIFFDSDDNARIQSEKLSTWLNSFGVETVEMDTENENDPAEISDRDVKYYKKYFKIS